MQLIDRLCIFGIILTDEAINVNKSTNDWVRLKDYILPQILSYGLLDKLSLLVKLAVAVVIINSNDISYFKLAFHINCEWEEIGERMIIALEEIKRFSAIQLIENGFTGPYNGSSNQFNGETVKGYLLQIFPDHGEPLPAYIKTEMLRQRILKLQTEIYTLVDNLQRTNDPMAMWSDYKQKYSVTKFTDWYTPWAVGLLNRNENILTVAQFVATYNKETNKDLLREQEKSKRLNANTAKKLDDPIDLPKSAMESTCPVV